MNSRSAFSKALRKIRSDHGFSTAHQFFKGMGGSKTLGISFVSYWDLERGKKLPRSRNLKALMAALGIEIRSSEGRDLIGAYLKSLLGSDELLEAVAPPSACQYLPGQDLAETAARGALARLAVNLTMEQWQARTRDVASHICHSFLANTSGWATIAELAAATKLKPDIIRKALRSLASVGLVEFSGDKARNRLEGKVIQAPPITPATAAIRAALRNNWNAWLADSELVSGKRRAVRMGKDGFALYRQHLERTLDLAEVYANPAESRQDSAIYLIEAGIARVLPKR